jgi:hypothetical protein
MATANEDLFSQYMNLINDYLTSFSQFSKLEVDKSYLRLNGINTITHVFNITLRQTADIELAFANMKQAINYYIPFIEQMDEISLYDLNISSNSASIFVYKKTIGEMKLPSTQTITDEQRDVLNKIQNYVEGFTPSLPSSV